MTGYCEAYSKTLGNINTRMEDLRKTLMSLQNTMDLPDPLWSQVHPQLFNDKLTRNRAGDLYIESQMKLDYLVKLMFFIERDQYRALAEGFSDFFGKRDLYWWQSALSLQGAPQYLEHEIIASDYYELARKKATVDF
ncbi:MULTISPECIES: hypothetical protein [Lactobacillaceae]|uniref:hypothetical protein n=1 Tax=Lactobacillaceae TaxID=33958 RepID=UPI0014571CDC|nr:hypothetical protein [Lactobacillus sp. HBUAS51381]NLR10469.1 hypothetical protein [Lactobacillus sp. HBUAS51381]